MMISKCDRCKSVFEANIGSWPCYSKGALGPEYAVIAQKCEKSSDLSSLDICDTCREEFKNWWWNEKI